MNQEHGFGVCNHTSMSCCETHGHDCEQGRDCPVRTGVITPEQKAYMDAARLGGGNVVFVGDEPAFSRFDGCMKTAGRCLGWLVALIVIAGLAGWLWVKLA